MSIPDARVCDDSDAQWAYLERERIRPDRVIRRWWDRIPAQDRERIVAAVPDGSWLTLTAGYRARPGTADVRLWTPGPDGPIGGRVARSSDLRWACRQALRREAA